MLGLQLGQTQSVLTTKQIRQRRLCTLTQAALLLFVTACTFTAEQALTRHLEQLCACELMLVADNPHYARKH